MLSLGLGDPDRLRRVLCIGAHCDDIEIGCGGTLLSLLADRPQLAVDWVVLSANPVRAKEARSSAAAFLAGHRGATTVQIRQFRDGYFPGEWSAIKDSFEELKRQTDPDLILCQHRGDAHQDHRIVGELVWNTWRDRLVLEYEIPKYDGDLGRPNVYVPLSADVLARKVALVMEHFPSQRERQWWSEETFRALARLRGIECASPGGYAEAFHGTKLTLGTGQGLSAPRGESRR